ncbi:hypothetical protein IscW_ISCW004454 [Ixodes scapularis]|uniref:Uncharacterized protein n=1 Tax=Ixodes scapularis TaxID=6945 RepID=B7PHF3_IXOSC|nr:hypothetical protein IscW_ISCW004454 [Ixodes scapularis]|eukprot:XP_002402754.1 hypothetical protein IscW_ISCW004454 [Ixodes scapularis]
MRPIFFIQNRPARQAPIIFALRGGSLHIRYIGQNFSRTFRRNVIKCFATPLFQHCSRNFVCSVVRRELASMQFSFFSIGNGRNFQGDKSGLYEVTPAILSQTRLGHPP